MFIDGCAFGAFIACGGSGIISLVLLIGQVHAVAESVRVIWSFKTVRVFYFILSFLVGIVLITVVSEQILAMFICSRAY